MVRIYSCLIFWLEILAYRSLEAIWLCPKKSRIATTSAPCSSLQAMPSATERGHTASSPELTRYKLLEIERTGILVAYIIPYAGSDDTRLGRESSWPKAPSGTHCFYV